MDLILAVVFTPKSKYEAELISSINKYSNVIPNGCSAYGTSTPFRPQVNELHAWN